MTRWLPLQARCVYDLTRFWCCFMSVPLQTVSVTPWLGATDTRAWELTNAASFIGCRPTDR